MAEFIVILGPTASGKSGLSLELASELQKRGYSPEIVNADSMQLYKDMDIATAKLSVMEREQFPHHMFDISDPEDEITVVQYQKKAREVIEEILNRGGFPILVGGSMLYLQSVVYEMDFAPTDEQIRQKLESELESQGAGAMLARLREVDSESAERLSVGDARRIIRALELYQLRGRGLDEFNKKPAFWKDCMIFGLDVERALLRERINARVEQMWDSGLVEETKLLRDRLSTTAKAAIGYQQVEMFIDGEITKQQAIEQIQLSTSRYAKKQMTWFRRDENIHWLTSSEALVEILDRARL
ncbi:MAG: tRNA (adenosine(37)-N6)-dimethylallyltransferase MiaA [Microbacteriaceae bacterium]|nr:tRNA (adenosine(37)-N6)-dimethylallyltransferase MiaA [Microbacteriaceae bacterium]MDR9443730.1 tRNA (adenosine(37)-N6)-dimethylallyltransferase MiaA [Microbacteriaceae bacterium]